MNYDTVLKFNEKYKNYYNFYLKNISNKNFIIKEPNNIGIKDKIFYKSYKYFCFTCPFAWASK